jgi:hypothetical protein
MLVSENCFVCIENSGVGGPPGDTEKSSATSSVVTPGEKVMEAGLGLVLLAVIVL